MNKNRILIEVYKGKIYQVITDKPIKLLVRNLDNLTVYKSKAKIVSGKGFSGQIDTVEDIVDSLQLMRDIKGGE